MMMRPGQHNNNNKRGRGRNRGRQGGGGYSGGGGHSGSHGGNPANRVYDSNGPDVKVRGTAQTVADKYMQLGRDAQLSGDGVMAESYYQHAEHYYRLWLANQPAGQPIHFPRRPGLDEEYEEDSADGAGDAGEGEELAAEGVETVEAAAPEGEQQQRQENFRQNRPQREAREGEGNRDNNREGGRRDRNRWQQRRERNFDGNREDVNSNPGERVDAPVVQTQERAERVAEPVQQAAPQQDAGDNWEAPSFLTRPVPLVRDVVADIAEVTPAPRRGRPRKVVADLAPVGEGEPE